MPFNALMPGEHDYLKGQPMPGQGASPVAEPKKKRPIMNALGSYLQFAAPEQYEAGRQARFGRDIGNALANEDYGTASKLKMQSGDFEGGIKIKDYASGMDAEKRKAEAQSTYQLFSSMQPLQINEMAMSDPAGFEQYTGMTSEEYLQTAQRLQQSGMTPEQFHQFVIQKAQAELGMESKPTKYALDLKEVMDPETGKMVIVQASEAGGVRPVDGYAPAPGAKEYVYENVGEDVVAINKNDPTDRTVVGKAPATSSGGGAGEFGLAPIYGRDANGNRVLIQANKAGGVRQANLPEGVTLEDDYSRTFDRETAKTDAQRAGGETKAGRAVSAFTDKANTLITQIDDAILKTNKGNTGMIGQFIMAGDLDGVLDSIGAKAMLSELIAIKDQGGTLGALSDGEGKALRDAAVNVSRSQSEEQLDKNLQAYRVQLEKTTLTMQRAFEEEYAKGNYRAPAPPPADTNTTNVFEDLMNRYLPQ